MGTHATIEDAQLQAKQLQEERERRRECFLCVWGGISIFVSFLPRFLLVPCFQVYDCGVENYQCLEE